MKIIYKIILITWLLLAPSFGWALGGTQTLSTKSGTSIITEVRYFLKEATAAYWSDAMLLNWINSGIRDIVSQSRCLEFIDIIQLSSGQTSYSMTSPYLGINDVFLYDSGNSIYKYLTPSNPKIVGFEGLEAGEPVYWWENYGNILIYPAPDESGTSMFVSGVSSPSLINSSSEFVRIPMIFENALVYYVTAQAMYRAGRYNEANSLMTQYNYLITLFRQQYIDYKADK